VPGSSCELAMLFRGSPGAFEFSVSFADMAG
jgi:hypothetical protein